MTKVETLTAYSCKFSYLQRNQYRRIAKIEPTIDFRKDETL